MSEQETQAAGRITAANITAALSTRLGTDKPMGEIVGWPASEGPSPRVRIESAFWDGPFLKLRLANGQHFVALFSEVVPRL